MLSYQSINKVDDNMEWVNKTRKVDVELSDYLSIIQDAETGQRGFIITGKESFLEPSNSTIEQFKFNIVQLRDLTKDNPKQQQRIDTLQNLSELKMALIKQIIATRRENGFDAAQGIVNTEIGKILMDKIRKTITEMRNEEERLLQERTKAADKSWQVAITFIISGGIFSIAIVIFLMFFINRDLKKRLQLEKDLVQAKELVEKRADELIIANKELVFQNEEKEKRAAELIIANEELTYQNNEKKKRAAELIIANRELAFQNEEKEKRAAELIIANKELLAFTYISSHDLQEPLRKIQIFISIILQNESENLSEDGKHNLERTQLAAGRMQQLIDDLLAFSRISTTELKFEKTNLNLILEEVKADLKEVINEKKAIIETAELGTVNIIAFQFQQLLYNLISNALKFSKTDVPSRIVLSSRIEKGSKLTSQNPLIKEGRSLSPAKNYCHITVSDNGIGFEPHFSERIFGVFQKLHGKEVYGGTGIGLAIVKKIVENHNGIITATSELNKGATFDIYFPG